MESRSPNPNSPTLHPGVVECAKSRRPTREWRCRAMEDKRAFRSQQRYHYFFCFLLFYIIHSTCSFSRFCSTRVDASLREAVLTVCRLHVNASLLAILCSCALYSELDCKFTPITILHYYSTYSTLAAARLLSPPPSLFPSFARTFQHFKPSFMRSFIAPT